MSELAAFAYRTTVMTPAVSKDLTVRATLKTELKITGSDDDAQIDAWIHQASALMVSYAGREFALESVVDRFRSPFCADLLYLDRHPVTAIASVIEDGVALGAGDYEHDERTGRLWRLGSGKPVTWPSAVEIAVTYSGGWVSLPDTPHDLERICIDIVKAWYFARQRDPLLMSESVPDVGSQSYRVGANAETAGGLPLDIAQRLDFYRRPRIA